MGSNLCQNRFLRIIVQLTIQQMMKNTTIMLKFCVALTSRFCAAEFSRRSIWVSLFAFAVRVCGNVLLLLLIEITRIDDEVVLLTYIKVFIKH